MWSEYFFMVLSIFHLLANSLPSSFRYKIIVVPVSSVFCGTISYPDFPSLVHLLPCLWPAFLEMTSTLSATIKHE